MDCQVDGHKTTEEEQGRNEKGKDLSSAAAPHNRGKNAQTLNDIDWGVGRAEAYFLAYDLGTLWRENVGGALPDLEGER